METIRNYLESMFKNLPQTEKVIKAKYELGQMMEDKYAELIKEGKSENEAVGTVISEFGNLEELASDLGIEDIYKNNQIINRRKISLDEVKNYFAAKKQQATLRGIGIALCILSVVGPIMTDALNIAEVIGVLFFFLAAAAGVALIIMSSGKMSEYHYLSTEACAIDPMTTDYVKGLKRDYSSTYSILTSIGVLLCILCVIPAIILEGFEFGNMEDISGAFLFIFVAAGVFLLTYTSAIYNGYRRILNLNNKTEFNDDFENNKNGLSKNFKNPTHKLIMEIYWPIITCIYLAWSFLCFDWHITWIIWPIAAVAGTVLKAIFTNQEEKDN